MFDLSQMALASASFTRPSLIIDRQPLGDNGTPGISSESRAIQVGARNLLDIPPVDIIGRIHPGDEDVSAYAVAVRKPVDFHNSTVQLFELDQAIDMAHREVNLGHETGMDTIDAKLILSSLAIKAIRNNVPRKYRLG